MYMQYAPEPRPIRQGRGIGCDGCSASVSSDFNIGYFRCGGSCNYDLCRNCGLERGGVDPDAEELKSMADAKKKAVETLKDSAQKIADLKQSIEAEQDAKKRAIQVL